MLYPGLSWIFLLSHPILICTESSRDGSTANTATLIPTNDWESTMSELLSKLEHIADNGKASKSALIEVSSLFFPRWNVDIFRQISDQAKRLVNTSLLETYSASDLAKRFQEFADVSTVTGRDLEFALRSLAVSNISQWQDSALKTLVFDCENWYARLVDSVSSNQTFVLAVPLSYLHLSALRERLLRSTGDSKAENERNLVVWLATYWQFVYDGYVNWKEWRMSQLQIEQWIQTTVIHDICHAVLWDRLSQRHLVNFQIENCTDPHALDMYLHTILSQHSNQLEFEMMRIVSKVFVLHRLIPGYENDGPHSGNYPNRLTLGPILPLTYEIHRNKTIFNDTSRLGRTCMPSLSNDNLKGITKITVHRRDWVTGIQVQYETGDDEGQVPPGGTADSMSFDPHSAKCLASLRWTISTAKSIVTSVTLTRRDGGSVAEPSGNIEESSDATIFTTSPALYCVNAIATCADPAAEFSEYPAISGFKVFFGVPNATSTVPDPLAKGLQLTKGSPVFALVEAEDIRKRTMKNSGFESSAINRFRDVDGYSLALSLASGPTEATTMPSEIISTTPGSQGAFTTAGKEGQRQKTNKASFFDPGMTDISPVVGENETDSTTQTTNGHGLQNEGGISGGSPSRVSALNNWKDLMRSGNSPNRTAVPGKNGNAGVSNQTDPTPQTPNGHGFQNEKGISDGPAGTDAALNTWNDLIRSGILPNIPLFPRKQGNAGSLNRTDPTPETPSVHGFQNEGGTSDGQASRDAELNKGDGMIRSGNSPVTPAGPSRPGNAGSFNPTDSTPQRPSPPGFQNERRISDGSASTDAALSKWNDLIRSGILPNIPLFPRKHGDAGLLNQTDSAPQTPNGHGFQNQRGISGGPASGGAAGNNWKDSIRSGNAPNIPALPGQFGHAGRFPQTPVNAVDGSPPITSTSNSAASGGDDSTRNRSPSSDAGSRGAYGKEVDRNSWYNLIRSGKSPNIPAAPGKDGNAGSLPQGTLGAVDGNSSATSSGSASGLSDAGFPIPNRSLSSFAPPGAYGKDRNGERGRILEERNRPTWKDSFGPNGFDVLKFTPSKIPGSNVPESPNGTTFHKVTDVTDRRFPAELSSNLTEPLDLAALDGRLWAVTDEDGNWIIVYPIHGRNTTGVLPLTSGRNITQALMEMSQTTVAAPEQKEAGQQRMTSVSNGEQ